MNVISKILEKKSESRSCALIPFITAGYPDISTTIKVIYELDKEGVDFIELGIPYKDSLADGSVIQKASKVAIEQGVYIDQVLSLLKKVHLNLNVPIIIFSYYNPILVRGISKFVIEIFNLGVKGLVIPDLPVEESDYLIFLCNQYNIELILFIAPTSSSNRILNILSKAPGCIYLVSSTGVTGVRANIDCRVNKLSDYIKSKTDKLIILGFGISSSVQVARISKWNIDGIVIGSALTRILSENYYYQGYESVLKNIVNFWKILKSSTKN
uniref:Tryptophan synthase alpha chain n=1 Tax=Bostrychia simpliciuscula TaxID=324754 RepID=A0A1Z1M7G3_9FLOR|nr:Tryptophan synthase alpha subunit [Bostrychia simpliciuscula]ARW62028.1 Tryptophan synthase alpha subunit [Bostrychia simpliciuscula]